MKVFRFIFLLSLITFVADFSLDAMKHERDGLLSDYQIKRSKLEAKEEASDDDQSDLKTEKIQSHSITIFDYLKEREITGKGKFSKQARRFYLDKRDEKGNTRLHLAVRDGSYSRVAMLLECSPHQINAINYEGKKPLDFATNFEIRRLLQKRINLIKQKDSEGNTWLHRAARDGDLEMVKRLIRYGAAIDALNEEEDTPLDLACENNNIEVEEYLQKNLNLVEGADSGDIARVKVALSDTDVFINVQGDETPLHNAAWKGHEAVVTLLLAAGALVNSWDHNKLTPLHIAMYMSHHSTIAEQLLEAGALTNIPDQDGFTSLHMAVCFNNATVIPLLLAHGADKTIKNSYGKTALMLAQERGYLAIAALLQD